MHRHLRGSESSEVTSGSKLQPTWRRIHLDAPGERIRRLFRLLEFILSGLANARRHASATDYTHDGTADQRTSVDPDGNDARRRAAKKGFADVEPTVAPILDSAFVESVVQSDLTLEKSDVASVFDSAIVVGTIGVYRGLGAMPLGLQALPGERLQQPTDPLRFIYATVYATA